jgi:hypothetical protein
LFLFIFLYLFCRNGFQASDFHNACDNKGPTLTIIHTTHGYTFGGYSPISWDSSNNYKTHPDCFIFTLTNPHGIPPTKYTLKPGDTKAVKGEPNSGVIFGSGHDIHVYSNSHAESTSNTTFPESYVDTTGKGNGTFTGSRYFTAKEIEVYSVVSMLNIK